MPLQKVFRDSDLSKLQSIIEKAKELWKEASKKDFEKNGDRGSCVAGDGIFVNYLGPRKRKPVRRCIISSHEVAFCMGSSHYESCKDIPINYLRKNEIECFYNYGYLD
jgi:hypothetical protein